jgi:hypothetical protein
MTYNQKPKTYTLRLTVNQESSTLKLCRGEEVVIEKSWPEERDMGKQLLGVLKAILDESGIRPEEVGEFVIDGDAQENFTSRRIAETVRNVYTFGINQK